MCTDHTCSRGTKSGMSHLTCDAGCDRAWGPGILGATVADRPVQLPGWLGSGHPRP